MTSAESNDDPTWKAKAKTLLFLRLPGTSISNMKVCVPGGHVSAVAAAAVQAEHNPEYTRAGVHVGSTAALKLRLKATPDEEPAALWSCTITLHEVRSALPMSEAMQAVIGTGKALPTEEDTSSTCMWPFQAFIYHSLIHSTQCQVRNICSLQRRLLPRITLFSA
jgi:hypothetical protein